jgi:hypothetical protein
MKLDSQAQRNSDLYRFDGRLYEMEESDGILSLRLRSRVYINGVWLYLLLSGVALVVLNGWLKLSWPASFRTDVGNIFISTVALAMAFLLLVICRYLGVPLTKELWQFKKGAAEVIWNSSPLVKTSKITGVLAWRRGRKFYLALRLKHGKPIRIGFTGYSWKEAPWREDAECLAAFLQIPLDIPPIIPE